MNKLEQTEYMFLFTGVLVFTVCVFLLGELSGFAYGYDGALRIEFPELNTGNTPSFAIHGTSLRLPIVNGYIACTISALLYLSTFTFPSSVRSRFRYIVLAAGFLSITYSLYYKYLAMSLSGTAGFLNPYIKWMPRAIVLDCLIATTQLALAFFHLRLRRSSNVAMDDKVVYDEP